MTDKLGFSASRWRISMLRIKSGKSVGNKQKGRSVGTESYNCDLCFQRKVIIYVEGNNGRRVIGRL